jgi:hypothetical protein
LERKKRKKRRAGKSHARRNNRLSNQSVSEAESPPTSTESTPEKKQLGRVRAAACASTTLGVEPVANSEISAKRKRDSDSSSARVPTMIGGLTISDFGDSGRDYKASLDRASAAYDNDASQGESLVERKYDGVPTSSGVTQYVRSHRQQCLKTERAGYHNRCALLHCEVPRLNNNPFVKACQCSHPSESAGDLLGRGAVLHPGPVLVLTVTPGRPFLTPGRRWRGRRRGGRRWSWLCARGGPVRR